MKEKFVKDYLGLEKRKVRSEFLNLRNKIDAFTAAAYSNMIFSKIQKLPIYEKAKIVMFYMSYGSEVVTDGMILSAIRNGKEVVVPSIENPGDEKNEMIAVKITKLEDANELVYGIRQPEISFADVVEKNDIDLVFVPGIVFDERGYRTGYGKGYFDRWLQDISVEKTIGLAYDFQVAKEVPVEKYDLPVGIIITEKRIIQIKKN